MADENIKQVIQDAILDADSLERFINGDDTQDVLTRLSAEYPTLQKAIKEMFENGGLPAKPFATKALMTASALVDGDYAMVTDDKNNDNGLYIKDAGVWRRTSYTTKTNYKAIAENQDILALSVGDYYIPSFVIGDTLINMVDVPQKLGIIKVENLAGSDVYKKVTISTFADGIYINTYANAKWSGWRKTASIEEVLAITDTKYEVAESVKIKNIKDGDDILKLPIGIYNVDGFSVTNLPNFPPVTSYKYGRVKIEANTANPSFRIVTVSTYRDPAIYINKNNESGWLGWQKLGGNSSGSQFIPSLVMPPKIYTMSGLQAHIYPEHLLPEPSDLYLHDVSCSLGKQMERGWVYDVPAGLGASTTALTWSLHDKQTASLLASASTSIVIADSAKAGSKNVLVIGDSYINGGIITQRLLDISATNALKVNLVGTRGTAPNKHEGRSGWTISNYTTDFPDNPFWFSGAVDFSQYIAGNSLATPDLVIINLGVNDSFHALSDGEAVSKATAAFAKLDILIASIKAQNAAVKIGLIAPPSYANQDSFGLDYGNNYVAWRCSRNIVIWNSELYKRYKNSETQNVYIVAAGLNVDAKANFPTTTQATNSHNTTVVTVQNNSVHPDVSGYKQMGDAIFAFIKAVA